MQFRGIIFEERSATVCRPDGTPMCIQPLLTIVDPDLMHRRFPMLMKHGDNQWLDAMGTNKITPIPERLLFIVFIFLYNDGATGAERCEIRNAGKIMKLDKRCTHM